VSKAYISASLRRQVKMDASGRCGYCRSAEEITGSNLVVDHLIPEVLGGAVVRENLWMACDECNEFKANRTYANDPVTGEQTPLFNPRQQLWAEHFIWSVDGYYIIGITSIGRTTVHALRLNRVLLVTARYYWVQFGLHPPPD
jgi:hypothetical protein